MKQIEYGFWFWSHKLNGILRMLSFLTKYEIDEQEYAIIKEELRYTNNEENIWNEYSFSKNGNELKLKVSYDAEEGTDMIHIRIYTSANFKILLEVIATFQSLFQKLEFEEH